MFPASAEAAVDAGLKVILTARRKEKLDVVFANAGTGVNAPRKNGTKWWI